VRQSARDGVRTAEGVLLPGGKGVLVQATPGSGESGTAAPGATVHLISAQGVRYPLGIGAMSALGYEGVTPLAVPASLLALVPTGPTLSRDDALAHFAPGPAVSAPAGGPAKPTASPTPEKSVSGLGDDAPDEAGDGRLSTHRVDRHRWRVARVAPVD
jgi:hypothetical protein